MKGVCVILATGMLVAGCASTPTGNIEAFANAAKGVTDKVDGVIREYNSESINNELTKLAQHSKPITTSSLDPVKRVLINSADKKRYALYKANYALGNYAEALSGLAASGSTQEMDLAAAKLYGSLNNFNEQYKVLAGSGDNLMSAEASAGIGKVVAAIGGAYAEKKRGEAIKSIVITADPYVQKVCDVIVHELLKGVIEKRIYTMRHTELSGYILDYNLRVKKASFSEKRAMMGDIYERYRRMQSSGAVVAQAINAINEVKEAHTVLREELENDNFGSDRLVRVVGRLNDMEEHYDDLEALLLSCDAGIVADRRKGIVCKQ